MSRFVQGERVRVLPEAYKIKTEDNRHVTPFMRLALGCYGIVKERCNCSVPHYLIQFDEDSSASACNGEWWNECWIESENENINFDVKTEDIVGLFEE